MRRDSTGAKYLVGEREAQLVQVCSYLLQEGLPEQRAYSVEERAGASACPFRVLGVAGWPARVQ